MFRLMRVAAAVAPMALVFLGAAAPEARSDAICENGVDCRLDQGWDNSKRLRWYSTSQGSRLLPLSWMLNLEEAQTTAPFFSDDKVERYGFLLNRKATGVPHLPLGFVSDEDVTPNADVMCDVLPVTCSNGTMRQPWIGVNCSTCHTGEIAYQGKRLRIEGGATLADVQTFLEDFRVALDTTHADEAKFQRFALAVLGSAHTADAAGQLRLQLGEQVAWQTELESRNRTPLRYGHARLDAFGYIFNKVAALAGDETLPPALRIMAEGPASYPFVWNTAQQRFIQWNGIAMVQAGADPRRLALVRNTSQIIGSFGHIEFHDRDDDTGYRSSLRKQNMLMLEAALDTLESPRWPEDLLGPIDREMTSRGRRIYAANCEGCHRVLAPDDLRSPAGEQMHSVKRIGTDIFLACNAAMHQSRTGVFAGKSNGDGTFIADPDFTRTVLRLAADGGASHNPPPPSPAAFPSAGETAAMSEPTDPATSRQLEVDPYWLTAKQASKPLEAALQEVAAQPDEEILPEAFDEAKKRLARTCLSLEFSEVPIMGYKARPLNGIWATAPYLHNGSVPTLYDLLLPAQVRTMASQKSADPGMAARPETFGVGGREFDPDKVGFAAQQEHPFTFRVRDERTGEPIPGNYNSGHEFGTGLSDAERRDLVEYLKSL